MLCHVIFLAFLLASTAADGLLVIGDSEQLILQDCAQSSDNKNNETDAAGQCRFALDHNMLKSSQVGPEPTGWWSARTESSAHVRAVLIFNRRDCCQERLNSFTISVDDIQCAAHVSAKTFRMKTFQCEGYGRTVKITSNLPKLTLAEVQVFGELIEPMGLHGCLLRGGRHFYRSCHLATDNSVTPPLNDLSCARAGSEPAWWSAQTESFAHMKIVRIYNGDSSRERLNDFTISVDGTPCASHKSEETFSAKSFKCDGYGRTIKIASNLPQLTLCEVHVFGERIVLPSHKRLPNTDADFGCASSKTAITAAVAGSEEACKMQCVLLSTCKYFAFIDGVCKVSSLRYGMTQYIVGNETDSCREVCVGTRLFCILQQHLDGSVAFNRGWDDYVKGFGDDRNFWTGLAWLNRMTSKPGKLIFRAELTSWRDQKTYVAEYSGFVVRDASTNYAMDFDAFLPASSTAGDSLSYSKGRPFSTTDRDNDGSAANSCSNYHGDSGWWFDLCTYSNPNGVMTDKETNGYQTAFWYFLYNAYDSLKATRLLIQKPE